MMGISKLPLIPEVEQLLQNQTSVKMDAGAVTSETLLEIGMSYHPGSFEYTLLFRAVVSITVGSGLKF